MKTLQNLPIGKSSFESIREKNDLYVDKTRHIFDMVDTGEYYFLSRPRRFGKSLTVSTLKCLFEGREELFDGLWIAENTGWEWKKHPVITFDFNGVSHDTPENLALGLAAAVDRAARSLGVRLEETLLKERFRELVVSARRATGRRVVILIDEYDKPIIDHLGKGPDALEIAKSNRDILKSFLGVIKDGEVSAALRFVFVTGVSKFSRVSIFSDLNNLNDITMNRRYAEMLGYTRNELETSFAPYIERFAKDSGLPTDHLMEKMKHHYDGYRFSAEDTRVYNPFSILKSLDEMAFNNYWFETGTPAFLVNLLRDSDFPLPRIENLASDETVFGTFELENLKPEAILFQTGYITIKDVQEPIYFFDYPNREVKIAFLKRLLADHVTRPAAYSKFLRLSEHLRTESFDAFFETLRAIFASIPYTLETKRDEAYFHTLFYLMVSASGADARSEVLSCEGRIDLAVEFSDKVFVIEFKCGRSADAALKQIREKGYADAFKGAGKKIILLGIDFDVEKRNVGEWKVARI